MVELIFLMASWQDLMAEAREEFEDEVASARAEREEVRAWRSWEIFWAFCAAFAAALLAGCRDEYWARSSVLG